MRVWLCLLWFCLSLTAAAVPVDEGSLVGHWEATVNRRTPDNKRVEITYTWVFEEDHTGWHGIKNSQFEVESKSELTWDIDDRTLNVRTKSGLRSYPIISVNRLEMVLRDGKRVTYKRTP